MSADAHCSRSIVFYLNNIPSHLSQSSTVRWVIVVIRRLSNTLLQRPSFVLRNKFCDSLYSNPWPGPVRWVRDSFSSVVLKTGFMASLLLIRLWYILHDTDLQMLLFVVLQFDIIWLYWISFFFNILANLGMFAMLDIRLIVTISIFLCGIFSQKFWLSILVFVFEKTGMPLANLAISQCAFLGFVNLVMILMTI